MFHRLSDDADAARAWHLLGKVHSDRGQQGGGEAASGPRLASGAGDAGVEAWIRYWLLQVSTLEPDAVRAGHCPSSRGPRLGPGAR